MSKVLCKTNQEIPQEMLLGNLLFMNLTDMKIAEADLINIFRSSSIPESFIRKISPADAFRRASSSVKNKHIILNTNSRGATECRVEIEEVKCDNDVIKRVVGIKAIDEINEDVEFTTVGTVTFVRQSGVVNTTIDTSTSIGYLNETELDRHVMDVIKDNYADWSVYHNKDTVKNIINRIVDSTHPVNLMPTGLCKFIPQGSTDLLYHLKEALFEMSAYSLNASKSNIAEIIPLIDTEDQRQLIEKNFTAEITDELFGFTQELKNTLQTKKVLGTKTAASYVAKFKELKSKAQEYESLLGIYTDAIYQQITEALQLVNGAEEDENV